MNSINIIERPRRIMISLPFICEIGIPEMSQVRILDVNGRRTGRMYSEFVNFWIYRASL